MNAPANNTGKAVATQQPRSVLIDMSARYGMEPAAFEATVRATCMPPDKNGRVPTREEFAAFLLVAREYSLNPITKEIYAFSGKGGGIVPIVSIDGWANLINSHGQLDGITFDMTHNEAGELVSCTCTLYRKDRTHPIVVTEYLSECIRATDPWKMKHRMLRHKSLIQCARYAFGFAGIYDEDEGERIVEAEAKRVEPPKPPRPDSAPPRPNGVSSQSTGQDAGAPAKQPAKPANDQQSELSGKDVEDAAIDDEIPSFDRETGEVVEEEAEEEVKTPSQLLDALEADMEGAKDEIAVREFWEVHDIEAALTHVERGDEFVAIARAIRDRNLKRVRK